MARASRIYVVLDAALRPLAAFTVKREARSWLQHEKPPAAWYVATLPDGWPRGTRTVEDVNDFLHDPLR